ncbi:MAG: methyltransferase domain-containing protein [Desulfobacteraceae bacterium]
MKEALHPASLILDHLNLFTKDALNGPVLDLACGNGHNGIFLATKGLQVVLADLANEALQRAKTLAEKSGVEVKLWRVDLEKASENPLHEEAYGAILVFQYLHRPLIPCIKKALRNQGILVYETFTVDQPQFGKPYNPDYLLKRGELSEWFEDWYILHYFEGILGNPKRAIAQTVCRKPM